MTRKTGSLTAAVLALIILATACPSLADSGRTLPKCGVEYLADVMDRYHTTFHVYEDFLSSGNHFSERGLMCNSGDEASVPPMDEAWADNPRSGLHCIRCEFKATKSNWGGWFFLTGALGAKDSHATINWANIPTAGYDLRGATKLSFWARGEKGGEKVKFFAFGMGRDPFSGKANKPYPDSAPQLSTGYVKLGQEWQEYSIDLTNVDLRHVILGFAWQTKSTVNKRQDITFYLDDISFDKTRLDEPRFLVSYETRNCGDEFDSVLSNTAYVYDNALAMLAFLSAGDTARAKTIADAMIYAQEHDRYFTDGRLRNAYQGGDISLPPGWTPNGRKGATRIPGWWDKYQKRWQEDAAMTGTYAGNVAWAILGLLAYYETAGGEQYLASALKMAEWIEKHCRDTRGAGGYTAGYEGWEPNPTLLTYKATEHNIDLYSVFERLYEITGDSAWHERALHALRFVQAMWDRKEGKFWTGTGNDGETIFKDVIPVDSQAWAMLALKEHADPYRTALDYAETRLTVGRGYDFNDDADGVWFEGTAQMALAFTHCGQLSKGRDIVDFLRMEQHESGGLRATDREAISTGFHLQDGTPWLYYNRLHVGATAWMVLAEKQVNPFWPETSALAALAKARSGETRQ